MLREQLKSACKFYHKKFYSFLLKRPFYQSFFDKKSLVANTAYLNECKSVLPHLPYKPLISIIVPLYKVKKTYLVEMLESIAFQVYSNWQLCIVDDCSNDTVLENCVLSFKQRFSNKVIYKKNSTNLHISLSSNICLSLASGDYVAFLDHDDRLYPQSLFEMVRWIIRHDKPDILYSDERLIDEQGYWIGEPYLKPSYSPELLYQYNYITHFVVCKRSLANAIGGFKKGYEGAQDHDFVLRACEQSKKPIVHVPLCLYQWRAHRKSVAQSMSAKSYAVEAGLKAVRDALLRKKTPAEVSYHTSPCCGFRISYKLPTSKPLVSIIIPSKDAYLMLKSCLQSIYQQTNYKNFEIIVLDNGSKDSRCFSLYSKLKSTHSNFHQLSYTGDFNFAYLNRLGAQKAQGEHLVFLNNDTKIINESWLAELLSLSQFKNVGAVGCMLLYPNSLLQHGGVFLRTDSIAAHCGYRVNFKNIAYYQNSILWRVHEVSAVTAACLMVKRSVYDLVGGFDTCSVPNGYGDIDFCLKVSRQKYKNLYTPHARLYHFESYTDRRDMNNNLQALHYMNTKYAKELATDPFVHPFLNKGNYDYRVKKELLSFDFTKNTFDHFLKKSLEQA